MKIQVSSLKSQVSSLKSQVSRSILFLVCSFSLLFTSCHKESLSVANQDIDNVQTSREIDPKYKAPSVEESQDWFEQSFGKTLTFNIKGEEGTSTQSFNSATSSTPTIEVTPLWTNARISAYLSNRQVLMVPVRPIAALN